MLIGQDEAAGALGAAARSGRLHHAWLLGGPEGVGKATLAYRFARWLLAPESERRPGSGDGLDVVPDGRTARQIAGSAHPNLMVLERLAPDGEKGATKTVPKTIPMETVRKALSFFGGTATDGGRRICIVDSVDDLSTAAANALLKTVEEPPAGALVLLVSHAPQRVLPTIRSRCRLLKLPPLPTDSVEAILGSLPDGEGGSDPELIRRAAQASEGSVARALALLDRKRIALLDELASILNALPAAATSRVLAFADTIGDRRNEAEFELAVDAMIRWIEARVERDQMAGPARLAPLAELCEKVGEAARTVDIYNLDRRAFVVSTLDELAHAVRRTA